MRGFFRIWPAPRLVARARFETWGGVIHAKQKQCGYAREGKSLNRGFQGLLCNRLSWAYRKGGSAGAVMNYQNLTIRNSSFINNSALSGRFNSYAGAVCNNGDNLLIDDSFYNP